MHARALATTATAALALAGALGLAGSAAASTGGGLTETGTLTIAAGTSVTIEVGAEAFGGAGVFALAPAEQSASWLSMPSSVTLSSAGVIELFNVTVAVPANTAPGVYAAGILATLPSGVGTSGTTGTSGVGASINVVAKVEDKFSIVVPGSATTATTGGESTSTASTSISTSTSQPASSPAAVPAPTPTASISRVPLRRGVERLVVTVEPAVGGHVELRVGRTVRRLPLANGTAHTVVRDGVAVTVLSIEG